MQDQGPACKVRIHMLVIGYNRNIHPDKMIKISSPCVGILVVVTVAEKFHNRLQYKNNN